ncbi:hypothetical protein P152DRAFT_489623 [Eremomyces bilateralis CBS 781.70]|uniref:Uncharacterized protein n=1 Tax=Eremomyces bilateralis CBS 781.70 TaxID=1392243 RepID=A0A6G1FZP0_9PEZI|nr:uncharacterized protein P152DRAFT_489623 [Eremomyces bilateralis CBS 781.70]KAF1811263.1 hypothetical protein P152DRAFT_489623 [Eremomyces bilateralis CBS 781.70]
MKLSIDLCSPPLPCCLLVLAAITQMSNMHKFPSSRMRGSNAGLPPVGLVKFINVIGSGKEQNRPDDDVRQAKSRAAALNQPPPATSSFPGLCCPALSHCTVARNPEHPRDQRANGQTNVTVTFYVNRPTSAERSYIDHFQSSYFLFSSLSLLSRKK